MSIDLTLNNILNQHRHQIKISRDPFREIVQKNIRPFREIVQENISPIVYADFLIEEYGEGKYCDRCGSKLYPFNRIHNLCKNCDKLLQEDF